MICYEYGTFCIPSNDVSIKLTLLSITNRNVHYKFYSVIQTEVKQ